jgi:hypothetical protein
MLPGLTWARSKTLNEATASGSPRKRPHRRPHCHTFAAAEAGNAFKRVRPNERTGRPSAQHLQGRRMPAEWSLEWGSLMTLNSAHIHKACIDAFVFVRYVVSTLPPKRASYDMCDEPSVCVVARCGTC